MHRRPSLRTVAAGACLAMIVPMLSACYPGQYPLDIFRDMHYQESHRLLQADRLAPPREAVPITGTGHVFVPFDQARSMTSPTPQSPARLAQGQSTFNVNCAVCHGTDGRGTGPIAERFAAASANPPADFTSQRVRSRADGEIFWLVTNGIGNMPPFGDILSDDQRWQLVQVIRSYQGQ
jgi:mono/diheme cytochrome c family protein